MARIKIFDSTATLNSRGDAITQAEDWPTALDALRAAHSMPVRCFSGDGPVQEIGYEFIADIMPDGATLALRWYQEFFNDKPSLNAPPTVRDWPGVNPRVPWGRETLIVPGGAGVAVHHPVTRNMAMTYNRGDFECLYVPLSIHTLWVRLAVYVSLADCTAITATQDTHIQIFAHAGGHDEKLYLQEQGALPYAYNAFE